MKKLKTTNIVTKIVEMLTPLSPEDRKRVVHAALTLLGEATVDLDKKRLLGANNGETGDVPPRAMAWMKQNGLSEENLHQVFHFSEGNVEVIASEMPGKNDKERTYNAYVLAGIAKLLSSGISTFDDKSARALCKSSGCFNTANHSAYLADKGNEFAGSKAKGWMLTTPGLKRGAALVKELNK